jgi:hypothetical protein
VRPRIDVTIEVNSGGAILQAFTAHLLEPLLHTCDVHIHVERVGAPGTRTEKN